MLEFVSLFYAIMCDAFIILFYVPRATIFRKKLKSGGSITTEPVFVLPSPTTTSTVTWTFTW